MATENQPEHLNTFSKGANMDGNPEITFAQPGTGFYIDARNAEPSSNDKDDNALSKIRGEELKYANSTSATGYKCMASFSVREDLVELWAPINPLFPGIVRVNGVIVLQSVLFELRVDFPIQYDTNPAEEYSEFAFTDKRSVPYILDVTDTVASLTSNPQKYFANFEPKLYQINIQSPLDIPVFVELINVGGGGGRPVGQDTYQIRYSSKAGDRTQWSQATPMIPIPQSLSSDSLQYPWTRTFGGPPKPSSVTAFAPKIRFRVTNLYNYDFIEIKRTSHNAGAGIEYTPNGVIVAKIDISPGEISVRDYIDPSESNTNIDLSDEDETQELSQIETAGSIKYFDRRIVLGDIKLASKESALTFKTLNGKEGFPVINKLFKEGYKDPFNHVYYRDYMRGEKYSFGAFCYDGVGTRGFVNKSSQLSDYQFPNRRDAIATETADYSPYGTVKAATSQVTVVGQTHEVFDHYNSTQKTDLCSFKNIIEKGRVLGLTGTRSVSTVTEDCQETDPEIENHGTNVSAANLVSSSYQPFHPTKQTDQDVTGHNYIVNTKIDQGNNNVTIEGADTHDYRPKCFGPDYYAMGMMLPGIQNFPSWARAFSVVRTEPAKRVVCQGLGYYKLVKGEFKLITSDSLGGKEQDKVWFYAPDIENGIVSSDVVNDIIDNPQNYKMQFVSPLGFFSEWYSAEDKFSLITPERDRCVDMISYARMLRDQESDPDEQINPFEDVNMGITGGDGYNYIRYDKFRNINQDPAFFDGNAAKGNRIMPISGIKRVAEGRGTYLEIQTDLFYGKASVGGNSEAGFEDDGLKDWTEPLYIINIIRTGASVKDNNIQEYKQTTHYQKLESVIGKSNGLLGQKFLLVDERWEDSIPALQSTHFGASTDRYIYIKKPDGTVEKWINVSFKTAAQKATIIANILSNVTPLIKGVYTHRNIDDRDRFFEITFNEPQFIPPLDSLILVRYDDTAPIRVYGGDSFIGETIFAPIDSQASARDDAAETQFAFGIGLPYRNFKINPRYYTIRKAGAAANAIQDATWFSLGFIRQLCVMFTVESRTACHLAHNLAYPNQYFPLINYVIRPNRWDADKDYKDNHVFDDYGDDYTLDERSQWKWGGFRFLQQINPDYSVEAPISAFSKPQVGFEEKTEFPTMKKWSLPRAVNVQNAPGLKTFSANSSFILDDNQGRITYLWVANTEFGENLYALTDSGVEMSITKKSILSDANAKEIAFASADNFITGQRWISREIGCPDKMFRGIAEASVAIPQENGSEVKQQALFFPSKQSVYRLMNNVIVDIGRADYYTKVYNEGISKILSGTQTDLTAVYNIYKQQYWIYIKGEDVDNLYVFSQRKNQWIGYFDYKFDAFSVRNNETFGHRDLQTFELDKGYVINGSPVVYEVDTAMAPEQVFDKEFIRIRMNGTDGIKPTRVEFRKTLGGPVQCSLDPTNVLQGAFYVKNYRGYEQYIPRIDASVNSERPRFQQRLIFVKIIHNLASEFKIIDTTVQFKKLV